ncbi:DUF6994 family protein [Yimella lutea]|uniref:DUF6994 family protein n=1 Tax=Yimella lutea TaxID=587872 RepID=UPI00336E55E5
MKAIIAPGWGEAALANEIRPSLLNRFARSYRTIGGHLVFPANRIGGKVTINGAKGFHPRIKDRSGPDARVHPPALRGRR